MAREAEMSYDDLPVDWRMIPGRLDLIISESIRFRADIDDFADLPAVSIAKFQTWQNAMNSFSENVL